MEGQDRLEVGIMGAFGSPGTPVADWVTGHLRLVPGDHARLTLVSLNVLPGDLRSFDDIEGGIFGLTEIGFVLLTGIFRHSRARPLYGEVRTFEAGNLVTEVELEELDQDLTVSASLHYLGLPEWMPAEVLTEGYNRDHPGGGWDVAIRHQAPITTELSAGWQLHLQASWTMGGRNDARTYTTPLAVRTESSSREPLCQHLQRLDAINALLVLAHPSDVQAISGFARLTEGSRPGNLWDRHFMRDTKQSGSNEFAVFGLEHMGGIDGCARWVQLCLDHRRAVEPVVRPRLLGGGTPETSLLATCSAAEHWVSVHRKAGAKWAKKRKDYGIFEALMTRVDRKFDNWIAQPSAWGERVWRRYNELKHDPSAAVDPEEIAALEYSARWLLAAALLDHCAQTQMPSRQIFDNRLWQQRDWVRETLFD